MVDFDILEENSLQLLRTLWLPETREVEKLGPGSNFFALVSNPLAGYWIAQRKGHPFILSRFHFGTPPLREN